MTSVAAARLGITAVLALGLLGLPPSAASKALRTFDLHVSFYCHPKEPGDPFLCRGQGGTWTGVADIERDVERRVLEINRLYRDSGISFRFAGVSYHEDPVFASITGPGDQDPLGADLVNALKVATLHQSAQADPTRIELFVLHGRESARPDLGGIGICWSPIPPERRCNGGANHLKLCPANACGGGACEVWPLYHHGFFCVPVAFYQSWSGGRGLLGHELGHHLCQSHTHTGTDPGPGATSGTCGPPVSHDGDGLSSTPDDPGPARLEVTNGSCTLGDATDLCLTQAAADAGMPWPHTAVNDCRDWCEWLRLPGLVTPDSPTDNYCAGSCFQSRPAGVIGGPEQPDFANVMSYYHKPCAGPYVIKPPPGQSVPTVVEGLTSEQIQGIKSCLATVAGRAWADVCEGRGDDTDHDGHCDLDDPCPLVPNTAEDADGDTVPDACDLCDHSPDPANLDTDGDGSGDACDPNDDNDACPDGVDQHPLEAQVPVGTILHPGCPVGSEPLLADESANTDPDGPVITPDCMDTDDDGDGVLDADDPCPLVPGVDPATCTSIGPVCPPPEPPWKVCEGPLCGLDFDLVLISLVSPVQPIVFDHFQIVGDHLVVAPLPGRTLAETLGAFPGGLFPDLACGRSNCLRLEIRTPSTPTEAGRPVAEVASFRPDHVMLSGPGAGKLLRLTPAPGAIQLAHLWGAGVPERAPLPDADGDGVPDPADNCLARANSQQRDLDADGFGDACDLDLDQSGRVSWSESEQVRSCVGVDLLHPPAVVLEEVEPSPGDLERLARHARCGLADLDGNGIVDGGDALLALADRGQPPGPSGSVPPPALRPVVDPLDPDGDLIGPASDNCPAFPNPDQADRDANGIGDACECGDQNGDGRVDVRDLVAINWAIFRPALATPLCDTNNDARCTVSDIVGANLKIFGAAAYCARYPRPAA